MGGWCWLWVLDINPIYSDFFFKFSLSFEIFFVLVQEETVINGDLWCPVPDDPLLEVENSGHKWKVDLRAPLILVALLKLHLWEYEGPYTIMKWFFSCGFLVCDLWENNKQFVPLLGNGRMHRPKHCYLKGPEYDPWRGWGIIRPVWRVETKVGSDLFLLC